MVSNVGKFAIVKERPAEWGIIVSYDGDWYYLAFCGDTSTILIFDRDELRIPRKAPEWAKKSIENCKI